VHQQDPPSGALIGRLVSGGQTGADRAALDVALRLGIPYGGWCPLGGLAEDHPEPPGLLVAYPGLRETPSPDPAERTEWNVRDGDATLLLTDAPGPLSGGTALTRDVAVDLGRPWLVATTTDAATVLAWLRGLREETGRSLVLNVAGPRESNQPGLHAASCRLLERLLRDGRPRHRPAPRSAPPNDGP
jgi:hypothetical protein